MTKRNRGSRRTRERKKSVTQREKDETVQIEITPSTLVWGMIRFNPTILQIIRKEDSITLDALIILVIAFVVKNFVRYLSLIIIGESIFDLEFNLKIILILVYRGGFIFFWIGFFILFEEIANWYNKKYSHPDSIIHKTTPEGIFRLAAFCYIPYTLIFTVLRVTEVLQPDFFFTDIIILLSLIVLVIILTKVTLKHDMWTSLLIGIFTSILPIFFLSLVVAEIYV